MQAIRLPEMTAAATGYTHMVKLTHADLTETAANTAQTIAILDVAAGDVVRGCAIKTVTAFEDASDNTYNSTTLIVGDGGSTNRFLASTELNVNGTEVLWKATASGSAMPYAYTAADTIDVVVGSMAAMSLSNIDTGEVHIFLGIAELAKIQS